MTSSDQSVARDVFLYLLMIVVLGMSAVNLGNLVFQFINQAFPEPGEFQSLFTNAMRFPLASLVVVVPVLAWVMRFLHRDIAANPAKQELKIRKWLLYLTLFVTGLIVIGDLIGLIVGYLNGDLTLRFALKFLTILVLSGSIFYYYLHEMHGDVRGKVAWLGKTMLGLAVIAVIYGFIQVGSPAAQRARNQDNDRVNDLSVLQSQVVAFWTAKERLPSNLSELEDNISGFRVPVDPVTETSYEYTRTGSLTFTLCATFATESYQEAEAYPIRYPGLKAGMSAGSWEHGIGRTCFDREIDPDLYPAREAL